MKLTRIIRTFLLAACAAATPMQGGAGEDAAKCSAVGAEAVASTELLWPPNGKFMAVSVTLEGYDVTITSIQQDEDPGAGPQRKNVIQQFFEGIVLFFQNFFRGLFGRGSRRLQTDDLPEDLEDEDYGTNYDDVEETPIDAGLDPNNPARAFLRSERLGKGDGRIYYLNYQILYDKANALTCEGTVQVCVPKSPGVGNGKTPCVESMPLYDSY